jgi:hypothetical protein
VYIKITIKNFSSEARESNDSLKYGIYEPIGNTHKNNYWQPSAEIPEYMEY